MRRLISTYVVRMWLKQVFSWHGSLILHTETFGGLSTDHRAFSPSLIIKEIINLIAAIINNNFRHQEKQFQWISAKLDLIWHLHVTTNIEEETSIKGNQKYFLILLNVILDWNECSGNTSWILICENYYIVWPLIKMDSIANIVLFPKNTTFKISFCQITCSIENIQYTRKHLVLSIQVLTSGNGICEQGPQSVETI